LLKYHGIPVRHFDGQAPDAEDILLTDSETHDAWDGGAMVIFSSAYRYSAGAGARRVAA
jgi:two-component system capsular synthesis sensor histidine kinase RcsC